MKPELLVIDIGNSTTVLGVSDYTGRIIARTSVATDKRRLTGEFTGRLHDYYREFGIMKTVIASVVPELDICLREYLEGDCRVPVEFVSVAKVRSLISIPAPAELGADRICNVLYVVKRRLYPAVVIDAGTATTFDIIDNRGKYIGGLIFPGVRTSFRSLRAFTSKLALVEEPDRVSDRCFGVTTADNMRIGVMRGQIHAINGFIHDLTSQFGPIRTFGTGGWFHRLAPGPAGVTPYLKVDEVNFDLTLTGIVYYNYF